MIQIRKTILSVVFLAVLGFTQAVLASDTADKAAANQLDAFTSRLARISEFTLPLGHSSGKWYAEVSVNRDIVEDAGRNGFQVGIDNVNGFYAINLSRSRLSADKKTEVVGLMVDLDNRVFDYQTSAVPDSDSGLPLGVSEKPFAIKLQARKNLASWLSLGMVSINYGQTAFKYPMPAGYAPWYYSHGRDDPLRWIVPVYERVDNKDVKQMADAFWQWLIDRDPAQNPVLDRTGRACSVNQKGLYWFLAGGQASDRIERACTVPYGVNVVLPVMASMMPTDDEGVCKATMELARLSPFTIQDSFMEIDGVRFDRLQDYSASMSSCTPLSVSGRQLAPYVNWLGLWVTLRPLPRGEHTISFGARIKALKQERGVSYRILVQ